jgi:hypothetical protein
MEYGIRILKKTRSYIEDILRNGQLPINGNIGKIRVSEWSSRQFVLCKTAIRISCVME